MKDILSKNTAKEDIEGIKEDIKSLTHRLGSLKDHSMEGLSEQIDDLASAIKSIKNKGIGIGRENAVILIHAARQHPIKMLLGAFGIGMLTCCLIKKKDMLTVLLSGILERYLEYKAKKTWVAYAARFFAFLAMTLLIITNYMYFTVPEKTSFSLIATACCLVISVMLFCINFYIKKRRKQEFIKPFLDKIHLLENLLEKLLSKGKEGKVLNNYRTTTILGITVIIVLIIRRYLRKH